MASFIGWHVSCKPFWMFSSVPGKGGKEQRVLQVSLPPSFMSFLICLQYLEIFKNTVKEG